MSRYPILHCIHLPEGCPDKEEKPEHVSIGMLRSYGTKKQVKERGLVGGISCAKCSSSNTLQIDSGWGETVLCLNCKAVTAEHHADAMSGVSGTVVTIFKKYKDFIHQRPFSKVENLSYH